MQNNKQDKFNYENIFSMKNKKVVIFGGTGNLGLNFSRTLSSAGAKVYLLDKIKKKTNDKNIFFSKCDVSSKKSIKINFEKIVKKEKKIDVLIYNVYSKPLDYYQKFEKYNLKTWEKVMETNLTGAFLSCQSAINHFKKKKISGNIIIILSTYGLVGPDLSIYENLKKSKNIYGGKHSLTTPVSYTSSKSGLLGLTKYLATTCGKFGIRVNSLSPGGIFDYQEKQFVKKYIKKVPLGRMAAWTDYNGSILFLASDASEYMTGSNLVVDGGWTAW
jgi:NAD(P)-dependent dehydrogenase (short-subunit alcohol dehydrogenase family)|tara:strand:+ start:810 stop:1631 length:822 start_codon:yes stop_codon:yes gene_type:complete